MRTIVRKAALDDVAAIVAMGHGDSAFAVSDRIRFYEKGELDHWIATPRDNILLVIESEGEVAGFTFCKIMSYHWAMLDNFYVLPAFRGSGCSESLMRELLHELRQRGIAYLTTLTDHEDNRLNHYLNRNGFRFAKTYDWHELFLDRSSTDSHE